MREMRGYESRSHGYPGSSGPGGGYEDRRGSTGGYQERRGGGLGARQGQGRGGFEVRREAGYEERRGGGRGERQGRDESVLEWVLPHRDMIQTKYPADSHRHHDRPQVRDDSVAAGGGQVGGEVDDCL